MRSDEVVISQGDKIAGSFGMINKELAVADGRSESLIYSMSDLLQTYFGKGIKSDIVAGFESLAVSTEGLVSNSMDVIGSQVDGNRIKFTKEVLSKLDALEAEGKDENEEFSLKIGSDGFEIKGTIKQLRADAEKNLQEGTKSLEENISQMTEFEDYRALQAKANFSDGVSFRDITVGLGGSVPQMAAASLGALATWASGGLLLPVAGALTVGGGMAVTAQFYGENYIEGVKESMLADKEKYPEGINEKSLGKAIASGDYDNVAQDLAAAALMSRLEKLGAESTMKAFFKSMNVPYKKGIKSLFRGEIKGFIEGMAKGTFKQIPTTLIEGLTEVGQSTIQAINTGLKVEGPGNMFKFVNGENNWEEFLAGAAIGTVIPFGGGIATQGRAELRTMAMKVAKEFNPKGNLAQTELFFKKAMSDLKKRKDNGSMSEIEYRETVEEISSIRNAGLKVPGNFSKKARGESLDLMLEKSKIIKEIEGLDPELTLPQKKRIKEINTRLNNIGKAEDIINKNSKIADQLSNDVIDEFKTFENEEEMVAFLEENGYDASLALSLIHI